MNISGDQLVEVQKMDEAYFPRPWSLKQWQELNQAQHLLYLVPGAFCLFGHLPGDETAHLLKICVEPEQRGTGRALDFWRSVCDDLRSRGVKDVFLEVEEKNTRAQGFYKKVGFKKLRNISGYYSDGENAVTMLATL